MSGVIGESTSVKSGIVGGSPTEISTTLGTGWTNSVRRTWVRDGTCFLYVSIYHTAHETQVGPSGLLMGYFFDVRIEADEEEQASPENLKLIGDDYDVSISQQKISHFVNRNKPVQYWIALEPDSEF